jgi:hypothetical protein
MRPALLYTGIGILVLLVIVLSQAFFAKEELVPVESRIHYYRTPSVVLNEISIKVFYVLPAGAKNSLPQLADTLENSFRKIAHFHGVQFLGKSFIQYDIAREPIFLDEKWQGPADLLDKKPELLETLNDVAKVRPAEGGYPVRIYIVAGKGTGAAPGAVFLPEDIFLDEKWQDVKESVLYHMFGEALGLPSGDEGVMGAGMFRPLEMTFLEPELIQKMGLLN